MGKGPHWHVAPYFFVDDVKASASWYRDKLGFTYERIWGEPPSFVMVRRAGMTIMLKHVGRGLSRPNHTVDPERMSWDAYIWIEDADALYAEFKQKGVRIAREICDQEYGCRDFDVEDLNGYRLCFGQDLG